MGAAGTAASYLLAAFSTRVLQHLLYGVTPGDPATFAAIALALLPVAALSSLLPARRIVRSIRPTLYATNETRARSDDPGNGQV